MTSQRIIIRREVFDCEFEVVVLPSSAGVGHDRGFADLDDARAYAVRLGRAMDWPVSDLVDAT